MIDWHVHKFTRDWVGIEDSIKQVPLAHLPWIDAKAMPKAYSAHPLMGPTLHTFRTISLILKWNTSPGPLTPLNNNPDFPPGVPLHTPTSAQDAPALRTTQFFQNGTLLPFNALLSQFPEYHIPFYKFLQIRHFLNSARPISQWFRDQAPFEELCTNTTPQRHLISTVHALLFSEHDPKCNPISLKWERELQLDLPKDEWEKNL